MGWWVRDGVMGVWSGGGAEWWERDGVMGKSYTYLGEAYQHTTATK